MTKNLIRAAITVALLSTGCDAAAMALSTRGLGQVLVFPYYTVNANQNTVLTIVNTTAASKALKIRFREAYDGREALSFNVYLSPFDVWTATLYEQNFIIGVGTHDNSCTVPPFNPHVPVEGLPSLEFTLAAVASGPDGGPTGVSRLQEGSFDVFEMGELINDGNDLSLGIIQQGDVPPDCGAVVAAWNLGGVWQVDPTTHMSPPTGGLYGSSAVVDVSQGTFFEMMPSVIGGFSNSIQHTDPTSDVPDLNTASAGTDGSVAASVDVDGQIVTAHFSDPVDAVSALFMTSRTYNEYLTQAPNVQTDWVAAFPTKRFYVDPALNYGGNPHPFDFPFQAEVGYPVGSCVYVGISFFDRDAQTIAPSGCQFICQPQPLTLCHDTSVVALTSSGSALHTALNENFPPPNYFNAGHVIFDFTQPSHTLTSDEGFTFYGLPMFGFVAENFVNANVTAGVLANYSATVPHRSTLECQIVTPNGPATCQ